MSSNFTSEETTALSYFSGIYDISGIRPTDKIRDEMKELAHDFSFISYQLRCHEYFPTIDIRSMSRVWQEIIDCIRESWVLFSQEDKDYVLQDADYVGDFHKYIDIYNDEECLCEQCFVNRGVLEIDVLEGGDQLYYEYYDGNHNHIENCGGESRQWNEEYNTNSSELSDTPIFLPYESDMSSSSFFHQFSLDSLYD
jgi:hypothetical protein